MIGTQAIGNRKLRTERREEELFLDVMVVVHDKVELVIPLEEVVHLGAISQYGTGRRFHRKMNKILIIVSRLSRNWGRRIGPDAIPSTGRSHQNTFPAEGAQLH